MSHSQIPPSSASIWAPANGCPGWRGMASRFPETERSEPAEQGTAAHELAAIMVRSACRAGVGFPDRAAVVGAAASNGVVFDDEMFDAAEAYHDIIAPLVKGLKVFGGSNIGIERIVRAFNVHPESFGTVDFFLYSKETNTVHIHDFKYGFGPVDPFENWQLMNYAAGIICGLGLVEDPTVKVSLNIVQPRVWDFDGGPKQWNTTAAGLAPFFTQLRAGAARAYAPDAPLHSGGHCKYCPARHACPAAVQTGLQLYETTTEAVPAEMSTGQMAVAYSVVSRALLHLRSLAIGFEEQLKTKARSGESIPGYRTETAAGRQAWDKPYREVLKLGEMLDVDLRKAEAITPNQAKNLGIDAAIVDGFSSKPLHGIKLVEDDNRLARKVFSDD